MVDESQPTLAGALAQRKSPDQIGPVITQPVVARVPRAFDGIGLPEWRWEGKPEELDHPQEREFESSMPHHLAV